MPNYLKMPKKTQVLALLELGWSYRRIEAETGVRRETVSGYDARSPGKSGQNVPRLGSVATRRFLRYLATAIQMRPKRSPGLSQTRPKRSPARARPRFAAALYRTAIAEKLDAGLSLQRIWQDLVEEYGYGASYESVKRFVRTIAPTRRAVGVFHCAPGAEAQVDFFRGAPTLDAATGEWRRPWVFRMTLGHSRHGYEEAVWDQKLETFLRLHEHAFRDLGGVPTVVRHDNLKAAVVRACFFDPDSHDVYLAFAAHWGFTPLPTRPRHPQENGKQERSGGYVKTNALKGRRFDSLDAQNAFLRHWNRTIARLRIHGTTRRQVWTHFVEVEQRGAPAARQRGVSRASPAASARSTPTATSKSPGRSTRCRSRCSGSGSACGGTRTSCASSTATRSSRCTPASRPACLRRAPARRRPRRASKRLSIASSGSVSASGPRSSSGPTPRSPPAASAPFASSKASSA